ncbi:unnamed protein product [Lota lota]
MVVRMMASSDIVVPEKDQPMADKAGNTVNGKRKAESEAIICPTKKAKTINDGFCVFIGNLNKTKKYEEVKMSLANFLTTESLLVQDIRLHTDRTFAYVDLASETDFAKALTLNGTKVLDLPLRISKAKVKVKDDKKRKRVKPTPEQKEAKFSKLLSVTNLPHNATKAEVMGIFQTAVDVTFPGRTPGPSRGIAILHFETKALAEKAMKKKRGKKLRDRVIKINPYRSKGGASVDDENTQAIAQESGPTNTLVIKNLPPLENEVKLKKIFKNAVGINVPKDGSNARGFAFVEFKTSKDAKDAMEMAQGMKILKKAVNVEYCKTMYRQGANEVLLTTLMVTGLAAKTSEETLAAVFEGCTSTRIIRDKKTTKSKGFGFVDFAQKEACKAAKESMEDCEIDGKKVTLAYAKPQITSPTPKPKKQPSVQSEEQAKDQPKQKPESQPETQPGGEPKPVPKAQPSGDKSKRSKRKRNKKKGPKPAAEVEAKDVPKDGADDAAIEVTDVVKEAEVKE